MKRVFAPKTFAARVFRCVTFVGPTQFRPYRIAEAQTFCSGAIIGQQFQTGATVGQDHHSGITAGQCHG